VSWCPGADQSVVTEGFGEGLSEPLVVAFELTDAGGGQLEPLPQ
jgi:hypothetical protein